MLPLGFGRHGRNHEKAVWGVVVRKSSRLIETNVHPDAARLVQPDSFDEEDCLTVAFDRPLKLKYWILFCSKGGHMVP